MRDDDHCPFKAVKDVDHLFRGPDVQAVRRLDADDDVKLFVKLPAWFKIATPLGSYNPDWAVVLEVNGERKLYFVLETKGSASQLDLRLTEEKKIKCGRRHFAALGTDVTFEQVVTYDDLRGLA